MKLKTLSLRISFLLIFTVTISVANAGNLYWVGGQGNWTNTARWSLTSGGASATVLPDANTNVIFDINSGLSASDNVNIPGGSHAVEDFIVTGILVNFRLRFAGGESDPTLMNVHGDLNLLTTHSTVYVGAGAHKWIFHGKTSGSQEITSAGRNLHIVEFPNDDVAYHLSSNLFAIDKIDYKGGDLTTNDYDIITGYFLVRNNGTAASSQKNLDAGTSTINCGEYYAQLTYGALNITGDCTIKANVFTGGPSQPNDVTNHHRIILKDHILDYTGGSIVGTNNFICTNCEIDTLIINNTNDTKLADAFTVNHLFEVKQLGTTIYFNGGNNMSNEIIFSGEIITPAVSGCEDRIGLSTIHSDNTVFVRDSDVLEVSDVVLKNIITQGNATFEANNSLLMELSEGWTMNNNPISKTYHWKGNSGVDKDWNNPDNWELSDGTNNGCIPTLVDHVIVNNSAVNGIVIPEGYLGECNDFSWTKTSPDSLVVNEGLNTGLRIRGNLFLDSSVITSFSGSVTFIFDASTNNTIETNGVNLPSVRFYGNGGQWKLLDDLDCDIFSLYAGTFITSNHDIECNSFKLIETYSKTLTLGTSHILVNGILDFDPYGSIAEVTVNAGNSFIECEEIEYNIFSFYNLQLNNSLQVELNNHTLEANKLILNGTADVTAIDNITINELELLQDGSTLILDPDITLEVNGSILSEASNSNPAAINSSEVGMQTKIKKPLGNLCALGNINFKDINADMDGTFHARLGIDGGNNTNIDFNSSTVLTPLYWIGNSGKWGIKANWSNVSGGCPVNKDPNSALRLIFDDKSFTSDNDVVSLFELTNCKTMEFNNSLHPANFDIQVRLNPLQIFVNNAEVNFTGAKMYVQNQTIVNDGGLLSLDITEGDSPKFDTPLLEINDGGAVDVKSNTLLIVRD